MKQFLMIKDNRDRWPVHVAQIRDGETANSMVERFQRNLGAMTPGGLNGVTWKICEAGGIVDALAESAKF